MDRIEGAHNHMVLAFITPLRPPLVRGEVEDEILGEPRVQN